MTERGDLTPFGEALKELAERRGMSLEAAMTRTVAEAQAEAGLGDVVREEMSWLVYFYPEKYEKWRAKDAARTGGTPRLVSMEYLDEGPEPKEEDD
jgi:hypothetical protein